jgi:hypothetical protein
MQMWVQCDLSIMHGTGVVLRLEAAVAAAEGPTVVGNLPAEEAERVLRQS